MAYVFASATAQWPAGGPKTRNACEKCRNRVYWSIQNLPLGLSLWGHQNGGGMQCRKSNRAMALLKLKQWAKAELDALAALAIEPEHAKSSLRLAAARNALEASAEKQALTSAQLRLTIAKKAEAEQLPGLRKQQQQC